MRKFTEQALTEGELDSILRCALMAPSSKGKRSPEYIIVDEPEKLSLLAHVKDRGAELLEGAKVAIVVVADPAVSDIWVEDTAAATMMMLLAAEDLGLGSCWVQIHERQDEQGQDAEANVRRLLGLPDNMRVLSIVALGHKGMERKPQNEERLDWTKVHRGQW